MKNEQNAPKIRFKGFTDAWEQRKLKELASFAKGSGYSKTDIKAEGTPIILYGRLYTKYETTINDVDTFAEAKKGSIYSKGSEVIVPASGETAEDIARASFVSKPGILLGGDLNIIYPNSAIEPTFLALSISNGEQQKSLAKKAQGKSVVHLHNSDLETVQITYPTREEQRQIGTYFRTLDRLITLHQRKCETLQKLKKSMLQKMFPKNGSCFPEIRFAGFTDAWEQRKLDELVKFYSGLTYKPEDVTENGTLVLRSSNVKNSEIVLTDNVYVDESVVNSDNVKKDDIIVVVRNGSKALIGKHAKIRHSMPNTVIGAFMTGLRSDSPDFINALLSTEMFDKEIKMNMGATINQITGYMFANMEFMTPSFQERQAVGSFFSRLDDLITLHQRKLETLKKLKKAMLQKMFI